MPRFMRRTLPSRKAWVLGTLAFLWCAVLPFICWGAWATPGHAHAGPHFVFAAPPLPRHHLPYAPPASIPHAPQAQQLAATDATAPPDTDALPTGAARPDSLLILSLLLLIMGHHLGLPRPRRHSHTTKPRSLGAQPIWPSVPTPPPRALSTQHCSP